jgi:O-succinylbenzoate synthase
MGIESFSLHPYEIALRRGVLIRVKDQQGNEGWGDIAPLPLYSQETLEEALLQLSQKKDQIVRASLQGLEQLHLLPSVFFGLESALLSILDPLPAFTATISGFLSGSPQEMLTLAKQSYFQKFTSVKVKVGHLSFSEAAEVLHALKDNFRLRVDVNRAWKKEDSLRFFEQFSSDAFDYVEEPFKNPKDLVHFTHPCAVDESFPRDLSLAELEALPTLKAVVYKPTIQGGMAGCSFLRDWTEKQKINLVLSSAFESDLGHSQIACMARRLGLTPALGIGTYYMLKERICSAAWEFSGSDVCISPAMIFPKH